MHTKAGYAERDFGRRGSPSAVARIVSAHLPHASPWPFMSAAAQPAVAADRFAREIVGFSTRLYGALAAAERQLVRRLQSGSGGARKHENPVLHGDQS